MKDKRFFETAFRAVSVPALVFALVIAGCASVPTGDPAAVQLAADINAIQAGSAKASGGTVTILGGFVEIKNGLTIPVDVTLDVTAAGAALGLHDSTLTVNGTVNAGSNHIRLEDNASWGAINGSGTIYLKNKGRLLGVEGNQNVAARKLTLDGVTLVGLPDNNDAVVSIGRGGEFIMKSGVITGNSRTDTGERGPFGMGGGVLVNGDAGSTFIMEGGTITGNSAVRMGGGVCNAGVFTMKGGVIFGNSADVGGGVANVDDNNVFIMEGGRIQGSTDSDGFTKNTALTHGAAMQAWPMAKWPTGGTYTKGGAPQTGGSNMVTGNDWTDDTLIAIPAP